MIVARLRSGAAAHPQPQLAQYPGTFGSTRLAPSSYANEPTAAVEVSVGYVRPIPFEFTTRGGCTMEVPGIRTGHAVSSGSVEPNDHETPGM